MGETAESLVNNPVDGELWAALRSVDLLDSIASMSGGLDAHVVGDGESFSLGQSQLLCIARAIVRKCKILLLDEATASVDLNTDAIVQAMLRREFQTATVITIAHRLETVLDYDVVVVMDKGKVVEVGDPRTLLNSGGAFASLKQSQESQTAKASTEISPVV